MSPGCGSYFLLILAKWSKYTNLKGLPTCLCSFLKPLMYNPHPLNPHYFIKKMLLKDISSVITVVIFTYNCTFHLSVLVSVGSQKCSLV